jgi:hypothetical protein
LLLVVGGLGAGRLVSGQRRGLARAPSSPLRAGTRGAPPSSLANSWPQGVLLELIKHQVQSSSLPLYAVPHFLPLHIRLQAREVRRELGWFRCVMYRLRQRKWRTEAGYPAEQGQRPRKQGRESKLERGLRQRSRKRRHTPNPEDGWWWQRWWRKRRGGLE